LCRSSRDRRTVRGWGVWRIGSQPRRQVSARRLG
jgi:hypothetical protein